LWSVMVPFHDSVHPHLVFFFFVPVLPLIQGLLGWCRFRRLVARSLMGLAWFVCSSQEALPSLGWSVKMVADSLHVSTFLLAECLAIFSFFLSVLHSLVFWTPSFQKIYGVYGFLINILVH
jgi:hypothetical protein